VRVSDTDRVQAGEEPVGDDDVARADPARHTSVTPAWHFHAGGCRRVYLPIGWTPVIVIALLVFATLSHMGAVWERCDLALRVRGITRT
jgi:hypothetical protein